MSQPITARSSVQFQDKLPDEVDVVIIGAGVIGVFTGLYAAAEGLSVAILDKGLVAGEQSSRNWGWLRQQGRDDAEVPIAKDAIRLWQQVDEQTNGGVGFKQGGTSYLAATQKRLDVLAKWLPIAAKHDLDTCMLNQQQLGERIVSDSNKFGPRWSGAMHTASDARAEPWLAVPAVARLAHQQGVAIREQCAVRALRIDAGQVTGVLTESGPIRCSQVVVAAGAWSSLLLRHHGFTIPQLTVRETVASTGNLAQVLDGNAVDEQLAIRRRLDGGYSLALADFSEHFISKDSVRHFKPYLPLLARNWSSTPLRWPVPDGHPTSWSVTSRWNEDEPSPFEAMRVLDPIPNWGAVERMRERFAARFPALGLPPIQHAWAGMLDTMPDIVPIVDRVTDVPGVIVATGMSGHGMGIGPGFGRVIARLLAGHEPEHDLSRFRYARFTDGSELSPGPHL